MKIVESKVELIVENCGGSDLSVVNAARVSFHKESKWMEETISGLGKIDYLSPADVKLINYLAKHKHFSPFNHTFLSFRIKAPLFVARQLVKHEYMPWNEVSRRYVEEEPEFYIPTYLRAKAENVKQGSSKEAHHNSMQLLFDYKNHCKEAVRLFNAAIKDGVCVEQARMFLPQNMMTEWIWSGTVGAVAKMLSLRLPQDTQEETRRVAEEVHTLASQMFPVSFAALLEAHK